MPDQRLITGDLSAPDRLTTQQVTADPYYRPAQNTAGTQLAQLAGALSSLNPGLSQFSSRLMQDQNQQKISEEEQAGTTDRESIRDTNDAQQTLTKNRGVWTEARVHGFEMADAQIHANLYPSALKSALESKGLWNNEKANPQDVANAMADVRQQFMARGQGTTPVWGKTFDQFRQGFENGVMNQWVQHTGQLRDEVARSNVTDDLTSQLLSHQQLPTVGDIATQIHAYAEKSYTNINLSPGDVNQAMLKAAVAAHGFALAQGNPELANRIAAAVEQVPTHTDAQGNVQYLGKTAAGADALTEMHYKEYSSNRQAMQEAYQVKELQRADAVQSALQWKEDHRNALPSQIPDMPDELRAKMVKAGIDPTEYVDNFRNSRLVSKDAVSRETAQNALDVVSGLNTKLASLDNETDLAKLEQEADNLDNDPMFKGYAQRNQLNELHSHLRAERKQFDDTGKLGSRAFEEVNNQVLGVARQASLSATTHILKYQDDDPDVVASVMRAKKVEPSANDSVRGGVLWGFADLDSQINRDFSKAANAVRNGRLWSDVPQSELQSAADQVIKTYRPLYDSKVKEFEDEINAKKAAKDAAIADAVESQGAFDARTHRPIKLSTPDGLPTREALENVRSAAGYTVAAENMIGWNARGFSAPGIDVVEAGISDVLGYGHPNGGDQLLNWVSHGELFNTYKLNQAKNVGWLQSIPKLLANDLNILESNPKLMKAVKESAVRGSLGDYQPELQRLYRDRRESYLRIAETAGLSTGDTTWKPGWVDWTATALLTNKADWTDANLKALQKRLGLQDSDFENLKNAQWAMLCRRDEKNAGTLLEAVPLNK